MRFSFRDVIKTGY